ncbi:MAG: glycoside hydrolase family 43 protein [Verrucomicrobiae bacterium]
MTDQFHPGQVWLDTGGQPINAHGGGMLYHEGVYYWHGECRPQGPSTLNAQIGVSCYSSADLHHWKNEGVVLPVIHGDGSHPMAAGCKIERPKVIRNAATGKFVMWWHHDLKGMGHLNALAGVAASDSPCGPFEFIEVLKPHWRMFRDGTAYVDEDGEGYLLYATDDNASLAISRLSGDYLKPAAPWLKVFPDRFMEAPAIFKRAGQYYFIGSGCTGWAPNEARSAIGHSVFGGWHELGNPCQGKGSEITFGGQSTFVFPVAGRKDAYIFMADIWNPDNLADSRYVWLPITFQEITNHPGPRPFISWHERWGLDIFAA